jgi:hypothetical protein
MTVNGSRQLILSQAGRSSQHQAGGQYKGLLKHHGCAWNVAIA